MPVPLGDFISKHVYDSKLKSAHPIEANSCVRFVDVRKGEEEAVGSSWKVDPSPICAVSVDAEKLVCVQNSEEVHTIVNLVKKYYKDLDFCIITPYGGQRAALVTRLKAESLRHDNVYNVDSYQGTPRPSSPHCSCSEQLV